MIKTLVTFFTLFIISCSKSIKLEKYPVYNFTISFDEINKFSNGYTQTTKTDTIHSISDSAAYVRALMYTVAHEQTLEILSEIPDLKGLGKVYYFQISDSLGVSLGKKLDSLKIIEINRTILDIIDMKEDVGDKFMY